MDDLKHLMQGKGQVGDQYINLKEKFLENQKMNRVDTFIICVESDRNPKIYDGF